MDNGYKSLRFRGFEALTVEALRELRAENDDQLQEQQTQIDALKGENETLRDTNQALLSRLEALEARILGAPKE